MIFDLPDLIFNIKDQESFSAAALEVFRFQSGNNPVYREFISSLGKNRDEINDIRDIPFLPVELFRNREVIAENLPAEIVFESSRTSSADPSRHFVHDLRIYERSFLSSFRLFYGEPSDYFIAALLPSYIERRGSSLIYMMDFLIRHSLNRKTGFYRNSLKDLIVDLRAARDAGLKTLLVGVSFALLDLAETQATDLSGTIVMETGGMKGRRKEITRAELHNILKQRLNIKSVHSEYGMTELMSQAYSAGDGIFHTPPWMKIMVREPQDPLTLISESGKTGGINIIDLANIYSCSFLSTSDCGKLYEDGSFEVLGRFDNTDIRGCNLMAE